MCSPVLLRSREQAERSAESSDQKCFRVAVGAPKKKRVEEPCTALSLTEEGLSSHRSKWGRLPAVQVLLGTLHPRIVGGMGEGGRPRKPSGTVDL